MFPHFGRPEKKDQNKEPLTLEEIQDAERLKEYVRVRTEKLEERVSLLEQEVEILRRGS